tara:strand:- start:806 stop:1066 length:261 start_codon:yes stop_codon:yes gene_type:complete
MTDTKERVEYDIRLFTEEDHFILDVREDVIVDGEDASNEFVEGIILSSYDEAKIKLDEFVETYSKKGKVYVTNDVAKKDETSKKGK